MLYKISIYILADIFQFFMALKMLKVSICPIFPYITKSGFKYCQCWKIYNDYFCNKKPVHQLT